MLEREIIRQHRNREVMARWLRNQDIPVGRFTKTQAPQTHDTPSKTGSLNEPRYNLIPQPNDSGKLAHLLRHTTARLGVWRAGVRPLTRVFLDFISDHAIAKEAVYSEFSKDKIKALGLTEVASQVKDKEEFLLRPDLGRSLSINSTEVLKTCVQNPDVQLILSDGLSGHSLQVNAEALLPALIEGLQAEGLKVGTPLYCKFARVILQDRVGEILKAKTNVILIGERPGLGTGDSLSAYLIYEPGPHSTHANRNCISNIHPRGLVTGEAVKAIAYTVKAMIAQKTSGVSLKLT